MKTAREINAQIEKQLRAQESQDHALQAGLQQQLAQNDARVAQIKANEPALERRVRAEVAQGSSTSLEDLDDFLAPYLGQ